MEYNLLPGTDLKVSRLCLGTMTWGNQNTEAEGHEQMDYAVGEGINFMDTAEAYAVPMSEKTYGTTETIIGRWLQKRGKRDDLILASKIAGSSPINQYLRGGPNFSKAQLQQALHDSLTRLQTDYIDIYQLHWPERPTNYFGSLGYEHKSDNAVTDFREVLETMQEFIQQGKIRYVGISNETPWGVMKYLETAKQFNLPRVSTIQNPYSLINRVFEVGLAEQCIREKIGLLVYSPLAGGLLSGKYLYGQRPEGARFTLWPNYFNRYSHPNTPKAIEEYAMLAKENNLSFAQMALAYVNSRIFVGANIIGATKMDQLKENIGSINVKLSDDVLQAIQKIHLNYPNPAP